MNYSGTLQQVMESYSTVKENTIEGRYLHLDHIRPLLEKHSKVFRTKEIGRSVLGKPIHRVEFGTGEIKVLVWSQMHGNETTTTKAVFDLLNAACLLKNDFVLSTILSRCKIRIIPMLNPDGAKAYTRVNAKQVDLNRDAQELKEPESILLRSEFDDFKPDFCLNLHDQRTIFSAGKVAKPATLSFLTPAMDKARALRPERKKSMQIIAGIYKNLQEVLPGNIGRYDDAYNINCTGDTFQTAGVPTILFEAGHAPGDYKREKVREYVYAAMVSALYAIASGNFHDFNYLTYTRIPQNEKLFNDIILKNVLINNQLRDISIQYKEKLESGNIEFVPIIEKIAPEITNYAHRIIDGKDKIIEFPEVAEVGENVIVNKIVLNGEIIGLKCE
ncbi:M14 family zinc carboxypeptidase [Salegentibacter sp.]|uniref:M14 family zinc carboxypeptidase n=1 Tax=Salegentibacter sp. TaxID=1903072 RepID=UPI002F9346E9